MSFLNRFIWLIVFFFGSKNRGLISCISPGRAQRVYRYAVRYQGFDGDFKKKHIWIYVCIYICIDMCCYNNTYICTYIHMYLLQHMHRPISPLYLFLIIGLSVSINFSLPFFDSFLYTFHVGTGSLWLQSFSGLEICWT